jgi:hypothetical protein
MSYKSRLKKVQDVANLYIRKRDCKGKGGANCISCGRWFRFEDLDAGHFIPMTSSAIRFDERNINAQCRSDNRFKGGERRNYYPAMVEKWGQAVVDELRARQHEVKKYTDEELESIREYYLEKLEKLA